VPGVRAEFVRKLMIGVYLVLALTDHPSVSAGDLTIV
jgi:hypothetical protein